MATHALSGPAFTTDIPTLQRNARVAGVLMLLSIVFGFLGEMILPGKIIVRGDAAATAANILGNPTLFRITFASYLVEGICDVALCVVFYILLKPVNRNVALLSAFFGIVSMVTFAVGQASFFASSFVLRESGGMLAFSAEQRQALAFMAVRFGGIISSLFLCMYGIASMIRGYLIMHSQYLPKALGVLLLIGGAGFFLRCITYILAPAYSSPLMLLPMAAGGIPLMLWLLVRGVDARRV